MSSPINAVLSGSFSTDAGPSPVQISLPSGATEIKIINDTDIVTATNTPAEVVMADGYSALPASTAITYSGSGTGLGLTEAVSLGSGFTFVSDSDSLPLGAAVTNVTSITQANPAVVATITPPLAGQVVRMTNTTGMLQISGIDFTVGTVVPTTSFQLAYLNSTGFSAAATAGQFQTVPFDPRFYPVNRTILSITQAAQAVVTVSVNHGYTVGQQVRLIIPAAFGMIQLNNQLATITAVTAGTFTVNVNTTGYTAFAFPTSAQAALGTTFAQVVPVGGSATQPYANLLDDATRNVSFNGVIIDPGILVASKTYSWIAKRGLGI